MIILQLCHDHHLSWSVRYWCSNLNHKIMIQVEGGKLNCMLVAFRSQPARTTSLNEQSFISSRNGNNNFQISNDNTALFLGPPKSWIPEAQNPHKMCYNFTFSSRKKVQTFCSSVMNSLHWSENWWWNIFQSFQAVVRVANKPKVRGGGSLLITQRALTLVLKVEIPWPK